VRGVASSILGVWLFKDIVTGGRATSIAVILGGSIYYTWVKHVESQPAVSRGSVEKDGYDRVPLEDLESGSFDEDDDHKPE